MKSDYVSPLSVADNMRVLNVSVFPPSLCIYLFLFQLFKSFRIHNQMRLAELGNSDKYFSFSSPDSRVIYFKYISLTIYMSPCYRKTILRSGNVGARSLSTKNPVFKLMAVLILILLRVDFLSILLEHTLVITLTRPIS